MNWKDKLIFVSAQPDVPYFHWQCEIYLNNFIRLGIPKKNIHILFGIVKGTTELSEGAKKLKKYTPNVHGYLDNREKKHYIPSIKPYLLYEWIKQKPKRGELFFLHDSDIVFNHLPDFDSLLKDDYVYMSDTRGYIDFNYIMDCDKRYCDKHPNMDSGQLLRDMCDVIGVDASIVKKNDINSGGAQYIFKKQHWQMWFKIYKESTGLYDKLQRFQKKFPISPGEIQFWTAEMWSVLWNQWFWNYETRITDLLDFSWATDHISLCETKPILHMAGVTENLKTTLFYKGDYINVNPLDTLKNDIKCFDYVDKTSSGFKYINEMKKIIQK
jgi:hypothetical protein